MYHCILFTYGHHNLVDAVIHSLSGPNVYCLWFCLLKNSVVLICVCKIWSGFQLRLCILWSFIPARGNVRATLYYDTLCYTLLCAIRYSALYATLCYTLLCAIRYSVLYATLCYTLLCAIRYSVLYATLYYATLYYATLYYAALHYAALYYAGL